ncbi:hypothetical protein ACFLWO_03405 [Chloroflexota bacterium]
MKKAKMKLPSGKLQISKPFTISDYVVDFVFDITVVEAGKSGKYILKPQIAQSGSDQKFIEVSSKGKPEGKGKPEDKGKPEGEGKPEDKGKPEAGETEKMEFEGIIDVIVSDNLTMTIDNETRTVDVSNAVIEGDPTEGREAMVKGTIVNNIIVASEVEVREAEQEEPEETVFEGTIDSMVSDNWTVTVDGEVKTVDVSKAEIEGAAALGLEVVIKGTLVDGIIVAREVEVRQS